MFTTYIIIILNFTSFTPCSCGGVLEDLGWTEHLIFNIAFIVLSAVALFFYTSHKCKTLNKVSLLTLFSISIVTCIFLSSEKQIKRNNAFVRRYVPHPVEKIGSFDLKYNSYYIAGITDSEVYLGNVTTPLQLLKLNSNLRNIDTIKVSISQLDLPYKRVKIQIVPPYFYVGDGTVPIFFRGQMSDWKADIFSYEDAFFMQYAVIDSSKSAITTLSVLNKGNTIGFIEKCNEDINVELNEDIIKKQVDGRFDADGMLLYNEQIERLIYTYYYRNSFEVIDEFLELDYTGKTIDTVKMAIVDVAHYSKSNSFKLGANTVIVNKQTATYGHHLYVQSDRLGKYESEDVLESASIIDVYDVQDRSYVFSFYLYHQRGKKLSEFKIHKNLLTVIVDDQLWLYRLKPEFFNTDFNKTHTAQYQE
jgi:hypothetical protein